MAQTSLHLLCRRDKFSLKGLSFNKLDGTYYSQAWSFSFEEAKALKGGLIYLHEEKNAPSVIGGEVIEVLEVKLPDDDEAKRKDRVGFKFKPLLSCKGIQWEGSKHSMAWTSQILNN